MLCGRRLLLVVALCALSGSAAGCLHDGGGGGGGGATQDPAELAADAVAAVRAEKSAGYTLDAEVEITTTGDVDDRRLEQLANAPIALHIEGEASASALTADATARFRGVALAAGLLLGRRELFLNFMDRWYGRRGVGLDAVLRRGERELGDRTGFAEGLGTERELRRRFERILNGTVSDGPELDGTATRQFEGRLDVEGIEALADENARPLSAQERRQLRLVGDATRVLLVVGADDDLPRRVRVRLELPSSRAERLGARVLGESFRGVQSLRVDVDLRLSDWGTDVSYERPARFGSLSEILGELGS